MYREITDITISGGKYNNDTLKGILQYPVNIVYGSNGSGKSILCKRLKEFGDNANTGSISFNKQIQPVELLSFQKGIKVFNEDYIYNNLKANNGLNAIYIGEEQVTQSENVEEKQKDYDKAVENAIQAKGEYDKILEACKRIKVDSVEKSHKDLEKSILKMSRAQSGKTYGIQNLPPDVVAPWKSLSQTEVEDFMQSFNNRMNKVAALNERGDALVEVKIGISFSLDDLDGFFIDIANNPREVVLKHPYLEEMRKKNFNEIKTIHDRIIESKASVCPTCLRDIDSDYFSQLADLIAAAMSNETEKYIERMDAILASLNSEMRTPELPAIFDADVTQLSVLQDAVRNQLVLFSEMLNDAKANPFVKKQRDYTAIKSAIETYLNAVSVLNGKIKDFNKQFEDRETVRRDLLDEVLKFVYFSHKELVDSYYDTQKDLADAKEEMEKTAETVRNAKTELSNSETKLTKTKVAIDLINKALMSMFSSNERLQIEVNDRHSGYVVKSRGKEVATSDLSTGERNIIALAYFITSLANQDFENNMFRKPMLIVVDDPVTSFDYDNKMGVMSFLKFEFGKILQGNLDSKILICSHDINTVNFFSKVYKSITRIDNREKDLGKESFIKYAYNGGVIFDLLSGTVIPEMEDEYSVYLKNIYKYATANLSQLKDGCFVGIGNQIRRVLDSYVHFLTGSDDVQRYVSQWNYQLDYSVFNRYDEDDKHSKIENLKSAVTSFLNKPYLNAESHHLKIGDANNLYSPIELQKLAKFALVFIFSTNRNHYIALLKDTQNDVVSWQSELANGKGL